MKANPPGAGVWSSILPVPISTGVSIQKSSTTLVFAGVYVKPAGIVKFADCLTQPFASVTSILNVSLGLTTISGALPEYAPIRVKGP